MEQVYFVMTDLFIQKSNYIQTKADLRIHKWSFRIYLDLYTYVIKEVDDLVPLPSQCFAIFKVLIWLLTIPTIHFYILVISPNNTKKGRQCGK